MHTPGEWVVDKDGLTVIERHSGTVIAACQTKADALLIARAPELREMVDGDRKHLDSHHWFDSPASRLIMQADGVRP